MRQEKLQIVRSALTGILAKHKKNERPLFAVEQAHGSLPIYVMICKTIVKRIVFPF